MSSSVSAWTLAPATAPLCAIGVAIAMPFAQLWPGRPGMLQGKRSVTVGMFHETSPMSSEPPPSDRDRSTGPSSVSSLVASPSSSWPSSRWIPFASSMSASLHFGSPTRLMFAYSISAIGLLKCRPHAVPTVWIVSISAPVMSAAPCAIFTAASYIALVFS